MSKLRPPRVNGRFQGYANGGKVFRPSKADKKPKESRVFVKPNENPTAATLDATLKSNRSAALERERRGPQ